MHKAYVYAVQEEGGTKLWKMSEIELTDAEYRKFFEDEPEVTELHACHMEGTAGDIRWTCSCGESGQATNVIEATNDHRHHKYEEMGDD